MNISDKNIDGGEEFDRGRVSKDYAKYRDIYPAEFYEKIRAQNLCADGARVLDLGTGTGVIPRNMHHFGAKWTGADISEKQINEARIMSEGMDIDYIVSSAENLDFPDNSFGTVTACQCFWYFDHERVMPKLWHMLKPGGSILVLYMAWLPFEDKIAAESEKLVLKYSPDWSGAREVMHPIDIPKCYQRGFHLAYHEEYPVRVHFTKSSWNGRMKACRGIGASLTDGEIA